MSGYGLPDPYGLLDGQPQMQIFVVENAKLISDNVKNIFTRFSNATAAIGEVIKKFVKRENL